MLSLITRLARIYSVFGDTSGGQEITSGGEKNMKTTIGSFYLDVKNYDNNVIPNMPLVLFNRRINSKINNLCL